MRGGLWSGQIWRFMMSQEQEKETSDSPVEIGLKCQFCGETFETNAQLEQHQMNCRERKEQEAL